MFTKYQTSHFEKTVFVGEQTKTVIIVRLHRDEFGYIVYRTPVSTHTTWLKPVEFGPTNLEDFEF